MVKSAVECLKGSDGNDDAISDGGSSLSLNRIVATESTEAADFHPNPDHPAVKPDRPVSVGNPASNKYLSLKTKSTSSFKRLASISITTQLTLSSTSTTTASKMQNAASASASPATDSSADQKEKEKEPKEKSRLLDHFPILKENGIMIKSVKGVIIPATERPKSALIGKLAPDFLLRDHLGRKCSLHATIALGRPIVLFFFPLAGSPHCTTESCSFRDAIGSSPIFNDLEAIVIGISQDPPSRSKRFVDEHHLGYRILHDENREVMEAWGVKKVMLGLLDSRCTFVIDNNGIVRGMAEGFFDSVGHRVFAERWLTRIEHELSGRVRRVEEIPNSAGDLIIANDDNQAKTRVVYGAERSATGGGIGGVPRFGAAPSEQKLSESQIAREKQRKAGFKALIGNLTSAGVVDARDDLEELRVGESNSSPASSRFAKSSAGSGWSRGRMASANENPSAKWSPVATDYGQNGSIRTANSDGNSVKGKRASWKALTSRPRSSSGSTGGAPAFSRSRRQQSALNEPLPQSPSIPPTYQNVDTDEAQFGQVDRFAHLQQSRPRNDSDHHQGLGIQGFSRSDASRTKSLRRPPGSSGSNDVQFMARPSSSSNEKLREAETPRTPRSTNSTNYDASTWATRSSASSQSASTAETSLGSHGRSRSDVLKREKEKAEQDASSVPLPLLPPDSLHLHHHQQKPLPPPGRRSRGPYDVPRDAQDEEDDSEEFVALKPNGQLELIGRRSNRPNGSQASDGTGSVSSGNTVTLKKGDASSSRRPGTGDSSTSTSSKRAHSRSNSATSFDGAPLRPQDFARTYPKDEAKDHLVLADGSKLGLPTTTSLRSISPSPSFTDVESTQVSTARRVEPATNNLASPVVGRAKASVVTPSVSRNSSILISPRSGASPKVVNSPSGSNTPTTENPGKVSIESIRSSMLKNDEDSGGGRLIPSKPPPPKYAPPPAPSPNSSPMLNASTSGPFISSSPSLKSSSARSWASEDVFSSPSSKAKINNNSSNSSNPKMTNSPQMIHTSSSSSSSSSRSFWGDGKPSNSNSNSNSNSTSTNPGDFEYNRRPSSHSIRSTGTFGVHHSPPEPFAKNDHESNPNTTSSFVRRNDSQHSDVSELSDGAESSAGGGSSYHDKERFARSAMNGISAL